MSARHINAILPAGLEEMVLFEKRQLKQVNIEMAEDLNDIEQGVKEAKNLVNQTQNKVEELAATVSKIKEPRKDARRKLKRKVVEPAT